MAAKRKKKISLKPDNRGVFYAAIDDIELDEERGKNPRKKSVASAELVTTVMEEGIHHPIFVRWTDQFENGLMMVDGRRRLDAAIRAGLGSVPVINYGHISDEEAYIVSLQANRNQNTFTTKEIIIAVRKLDKMGKTKEQIASILSVNRKTVSEALAIEKKATGAIKTGAKKTGPTRINARVAARASALPKKAQEKLAPKLAGKSQVKGLEAVKKEKEKLGLSPKKARISGRATYKIADDAAYRCQAMERIIRDKLKHHSSHTTLTAQLRVIQCLKGQMGPEDLLGWGNV